MKSIYSDIRWARLQEEKEGGKLEEFRFKNNEGSLIYRFIKKSTEVINGIQYYDIASFRGAGGPIIEHIENGKEDVFFDAFLKDFKQYCQDNHVIAEFAKIDPWNEYHHIVENKYEAKYYGNFYCNDLTKNFYECNYNRNAKRAIKKAEDSGVKFFIDTEGGTIENFVRLYQNTESKYHTGNYYKFDFAYIKKYFNELGKDTFIANAVLQEEIITSVLVVNGEDVMHYFLLGNNPQYLNLQGNSFLTYHTALYGQRLGKKVFDMGGGKAGGSIQQFKRNFTGESGIVNYYVIEKIHNHDIYEQLVNRKLKIKNPNYFPLYRG